MNTANMLIGRRDFALAEAILAPLASDPHNESLAEAAQQLLDRARARRAAQGTAAQPTPTGE